MAARRCGFWYSFHDTPALLEHAWRQCDLTPSTEMERLPTVSNLAFESRCPNIPALYAFKYYIIQGIRPWMSEKGQLSVPIQGRWRAQDLVGHGVVCASSILLNMSRPVSVISVYAQCVG